MVKTAKAWAPDRQDVIWIDRNLRRGQEMRDVDPFLVLSPKAFNERTSLVIGLPMTTAAQPKSFDWRLRGGAPHPMKRIPDIRFAEVLVVLNQIVQLA